MDDKYIKGNKLIVEFLGWKKWGDYDDVYVDDYSDTLHPCPIRLGEVSFNSDWNHLMPVVKKCKDIWGELEFNSPDREYIEEEIFNLDYTLNEFFDNDIEAIYERVVTFLEAHDGGIDG